nr:inositol monophosphatase family protein [uncultured Acetatifactor sp.]
MQEEHLLQEIIAIAKDCGSILLSASDIERKIHQKAGRGNFVTDYDSRVQAILKSRLLELVPGAAFLGEEDQMDGTDVSKGYAFIVDPIDGTANFTRNYHASCISIALAQDGRPVLGVVHNPYLEETFHARKGKGAYLNGQQIHASDRTLAEGLILFGTAPYDERLIRKSFEVAYRYVSRAEDLRRSGSAAIDLCMVASGRAEFFFELALSPWDYAAGALIVEEAGGFVGDLRGGALTFDHSQAVTARAPRVELVDVSDVLENDMP